MSDTSAETPKRSRKNRASSAAPFIHKYVYKHRALPSVDDIVKATGGTRAGAARARAQAGKLFELEVPKGTPGRAKLVNVDVVADFAAIKAAFPELSVRKLTAGLAGLHGCSESLITQRLAKASKGSDAAEEQGTSAAAE